jgi:predicted phage terminase large subunit-like protein
MKIEEYILKDRALRKELARRSHYWFFHIYLSHHITYQTAQFQKEMFAITENNEISEAVIVAFRGSGKSTIMSLSYPLWAILGKQERKFVAIFSQTQQQVRLCLQNIRFELETNPLLIEDFGPFGEDNEEWKVSSLELKRYDARISALSAAESMRGIKHHQYRPDLIIFDDVEDSESVKTKEGRDKLFEKVEGEAGPSGDLNTKIIVIGNLLHEDGLIMRLKERIKKGSNSVFRAYPLIDDNGKILWPEKFKIKDDLGKLRNRVGDEYLWQREYMLKIVPNENRIIQPQWITNYISIPLKSQYDFQYIGIGADLAITESEKSDYTSFIAAQIHGSEESLRIYICRHMINKKMDFPTTVYELTNFIHYFGSKNDVKIFIEEVGYQKALIDEFKKKNYQVEGVKVGGRNKAERLKFASVYVKDKKVLFPQEGCEDLKQQMLGFGVERHDDLVDAFSCLMEKVIELDKPDNNPTAINIVNLYPDVMQFDSSNKNWDKQEDQSIFHKFKMKNPQRIFG